MSNESKKPVKTLSANFHGVAAYDPLSEKAAAASYKTVAAGMTRDRLDKFFFPDLQKHALDPVTEEDKRAISLLEGTHASGFRISMVAAQDNGKRVYMPMIDDTLRNVTLLVGPGPAGNRIAEGVNYIDGSQPDARKKINDFMVAGAIKRHEELGLMVEQVYALVEDMVRAVSGAAKVLPEPPPDGIEQGTSVGDVLVPIALGKSEVTVYSVAAQTPRKFRL